MTAKPADIDAYIAGLSEAVQPVARQLRALIQAAAPDSVEAIRYGMPAFDLGPAGWLYFGVWKTHVGFYPIYRGSEAYEADLASYRSAKDTVRFKLSEPLPEDLITRIVRTQQAVPN